MPQTRVGLGTPLLRFRSDEQLVALFRAGHDEAFRAIHERYHKRLFAYARQMLPGRQDAEDALQDVFVRAYSGLRASDHEFALRAWLFRVAHNRCVDELRRPAPPPPEVLQLVRSNVHDPLLEVDLRESLRRLIEDIRRLPEQQRSALLMRELAGMSYADLSASLGISVGAVKSLLVRARVALAQAAEARDTSCLLIREQLVEAHDRGLRPNATSRKHMRDCVGCKSFRRELRGMSRQLAAISPAIGPLGILAKLGFSGGAGGGAAGGGGLALLGGGGATASAGGAAVGVSHLATILVAAVAATGGAVELQHTIIAPAHHPAHVTRLARHHRHTGSPAPAPVRSNAIQAIAGDVEATAMTAPKLAASADVRAAVPAKPKLQHHPTAGGAGLTASTGTSTLTGPTTHKTPIATGENAAGTTGSGSNAGTCPVTGGSGSGTGTSSQPTTATSTPATAPTAAGAGPVATAPTTPNSTSSCGAGASTGPSTTSSPTTSSTSGDASGTSGANATSGNSTTGASTSSPASASSSTTTPSTGGSSSPSQ